MTLTADRKFIENKVQFTVVDTRKSSDTSDQ